MGGANSSDALGREGRVGGGRHSNTAHPTGYQWLAISPVPPLPLVSSACVRLDSAALISLSCRKLPPPGGGGEREREREGGGRGAASRFADQKLQKLLMGGGVKTCGTHTQMQPYIGQHA